MSENYYLHDCSSFTPSCQHAYRIGIRDNKRPVDNKQEEKETVKVSRKWWQWFSLGNDLQDAKA